MGDIVAFDVKRRICQAEQFSQFVKRSGIPPGYAGLLREPFGSVVAAHFDKMRLLTLLRLYNVHPPPGFFAQPLF